MNCKVLHKVGLVVNIEMPQIQYEIWHHILESESTSKIVPNGMDVFTVQPLPGFTIELQLFSNQGMIPYFLVKIFDQNGTVIYEDPSDLCRLLENMFVFDNSAINAHGFECIEMNILPLDNRPDSNEEINIGGCISGYIRDWVLSEVPGANFDQAERISTIFDNWLKEHNWIRAYNGKTFVTSSFKNQ